MNQATARDRKRLKSVEGGEAKPSKVRTSRASDFHSELRALAEKHRKKNSKLTQRVSKLQGQLATARAQLEAAEGPMRKIERALADNPELPNVNGHPELEASAVSSPAEVAQ